MNPESPFILVSKVKVTWHKKTSLAWVVVLLVCELWNCPISSCINLLQICFFEMFGMVNIRSCRIVFVEIIVTFFMWFTLVNLLWADYHFIFACNTVSSCFYINRQHLSCDDYLEVKWKNNCSVTSVLYCVQQLCTMICTHICLDFVVVYMFRFTGLAFLCFFWFSLNHFIPVVLAFLVRLFWVDLCGLLWVDLIKWVSNVRPSMCTSIHPQSFF